MGNVEAQQNSQIKNGVNQNYTPVIEDNKKIFAQEIEKIIKEQLTKTKKNKNGMYKTVNLVIDQIDKSKNNEESNKKQSTLNDKKKASTSVLHKSLDQQPILNQIKNNSSVNNNQQNINQEKKEQTKEKSYVKSNINNKNSLDQEILKITYQTNQTQNNFIENERQQFIQKENFFYQQKNKQNQFQILKQKSIIINSEIKTESYYLEKYQRKNTTQQTQQQKQEIIQQILIQQTQIKKSHNQLPQLNKLLKPIQYAFGKFISQHPQMPPLIRQIYSTVQNTNTDQKFVSRRYANIRQPFYHNVLKGVYVGEWTEDSITGYGKYFYDDGSYFQGYVIDGYANNKNGLLIFPNGNYYKGSFVNSQINGHGLLSIKNTLIYNGEFSHELPHGEGTQTSNRGDVYQGQFKQGQKQGYGSYKDYQGYFYKGNFKRSKFDGIGTLYYPNGDKYSGSFKNGVKNGKGKFQFFDKGIIQGYFQNDIPHGQIQCVDKNGVIYKGQFRNGKINGQCQIILNKEIYQSYWDLGVKIQIAKQQLKNLN